MIVIVPGYVGTVVIFAGDTRLMGDAFIGETPPFKGAVRAGGPEQVT